MPNIPLFGEGNSNPLQNSCLGSPMDRGTWQGTVHVDTKESDTKQQQHSFLFILMSVGSESIPTFTFLIFYILNYFSHRGLSILLIFL